MGVRQDRTCNVEDFGAQGQADEHASADVSIQIVTRRLKCNMGSKTEKVFDVRTLVGGCKADPMMQIEPGCIPRSASVPVALGPRIFAPNAVLCEGLVQLTLDGVIWSKMHLTTEFIDRRACSIICNTSVVQYVHEVILVRPH